MVHIPQQQIQALRSVDKTIPPNSVLLATPDEIIHVETHPDPVTQKEIVLWDDILQAFDNAVGVRHKTMVVPFLKGEGFAILEPRRIAAMPDTILDVIVKSPVADNNITSSLQSESSPAPPPLSPPPPPPPPPPPSYESTIRVDRSSTRNVAAKCSASSIFIAPPAATSAAQFTPMYGRNEPVMDNDSHMDRPLVFSLVRGPQVLLEGQSQGAGSRSTSPYQDNQNRQRQQRAESATIAEPTQRDLARTIFHASLGNKDEQVALGDMYRDGKGVLQDYHTAMVWYLKAAQQACASAQYNIGDFHFLGHGVLQDFSQAKYWYLKAANQEHAPSLFSIGFLYHEGLGVRQDHTKAIDWYLKSANRGYALAQYNLGLLYSRGGRGVRQNYAQALDWYYKAALQGHSPSQYNIGLLHDYGRGIPQDYGQAMVWYLKAAKNDHAGSQYSIGFLYDHGQGVSQDYAKAAEWYQKAADQGYKGAEDALDVLEKKWAGY